MDSFAVLLHAFVQMVFAAPKRNDEAAVAATADTITVAATHNKRASTVRGSESLSAVLEYFVELLWIKNKVEVSTHS